MKYLIPKNPTTQNKEWRRILLTVEGFEAHNVDIIIKFIYSHAADTYMFDKDSSYQELFKLCKATGIAGKDDTIDNFFKKEYNAENFKNELQLLWGSMLILSTKYRRYNLRENYKDWKADCAKSKEEQRLVPKIIKMELDSMAENKEDERADKANKDDIVLEKETLPLVGKDSPYYEYVEGTVYEELYNLYNDIKSKADHTLKSASFFEEDMEQLLYKMQPHFILRNNQGSYIPMALDERNEIQELLKKCIKSLSRLNADSNLYEERSKLHLIFLKNLNNLKSLSKSKFPLALVMRGLDKPIIELTQRSQNKIGDQMSSREPIEYTDEYGVIHRGFFTEEVREKAIQDHIDEAIQTIQSYKKLYPAYKKEFDIILPDEGTPDRLKNVKILLECCDLLTRDKDQEAADLYYKFFNSTEWSSKDIAKNKEFKKICLSLADNILSKELKSQHAVLQATGIEVGDEISSRASAMSDVAMALGYPDLLVESRNVTIKVGDKTVSGVMMEGAAPDMKDPAHISADDVFFDGRIIKQLDSPNVLRSLADLQILDFLCGNTDRHMLNYFWKMDLSDPKNPKLLGVQGIDNDNSFGTITDGGIMKLAYHSNLKIISPRMAIAISKLSAANLRAILEPYKLRPEQVKAAEKRLGLLQEMIINGKEDKDLYYNKRTNKVFTADRTIHIVTDEELRTLTIEQLATTDNEQMTLKDKSVVDNRNIFYYVKPYKHSYYKKFLKKENKQTKTITFQKQQPKAPTVQPQKFDNNRFAIYKKLLKLHREEQQQLVEYKANLYNNGGNDLAKRSREFREMYQALEEYLNRYTELRHILMRTVENNSEIRDKERDLIVCYKKMVTDNKKLDTLIDSYLGKYRRYITNANQQRINTAKQIQDYLRTEKKSQQEYDEYRAEIKQKFAIENSNYTPAHDFKAAAYSLNQILGTMKFTLIDNLNAMDAKNEKDAKLHAKGVKVANDLEYLWNYSMNSVNNSVVATKGSEDTADLVQLKKNISEKKAITKPDAKLLASLENILRYEVLLDLKYNNKDKNDDFKKSLKSLINDTKEAIDNNKEINPARVQNVLHNLFSREMDIANSRKLTLDNNNRKENKKVDNQNKKGNVNKM